MSYRESVGRAFEIARSSVTHMAALDIPAYPDNFEVWYAYYAGADAELSRQLEVLANEPDGFDSEFFASIKQSYLGGDARNLLRLASEGAEAIIADIARALDEASTDARDYGDRLADVQARIDELDPEATRLLIARLAQETQELQARNARLEQELQTASENVEILSRRLDEARRASQIDGLTDLPNRRAFDQGFEAEIERALADDTPLTLLVGDIDHFKSFNDRFGHRVGDEVLKLVGRVFMALVKGRDLPARYGGEEFAALLPQTDIEGGLAVAEQIRAAIAGKTLKSARTGRNYGNVTMSFGCAALARHETAAGLMERADRALYEAKRTGRNRACADRDAPAG